jgi:hypothetical protein
VDSAYNISGGEFNKSSSERCRTEILESSRLWAIVGLLDGLEGVNEEAKLLLVLR